MTQEQRYRTRIDELETALQWIVKTCDVRVHRISLFDEIQERARVALVKGPVDGA